MSRLLGESDGLGHAGAAIEPHSRAILAVDDAEAIVLDLVQLLAAGGSRVRNVAARFRLAGISASAVSHFRLYRSHRCFFACRQPPL
jgi:hypothetical protein